VVRLLPNLLQFSCVDLEHATVPLVNPERLNKSKALRNPANQQTDLRRIVHRQTIAESAAEQERVDSGLPFVVVP